MAKDKIEETVESVERANRMAKVSGERRYRPVPEISRLGSSWGGVAGGYLGRNLGANFWRRVVYAQPLAMNFRDFLISQAKFLEWDIVVEDNEDKGKETSKKDIQYYKDLFTELDGDFDNHVDLMGQDLLDTPFGAGAEIGRENDKPDGRLVYAHHMDAATLFPTLVPEYPVVQVVPDQVTNPVTFPAHAINRIISRPRTEFQFASWGMAPPERIYLAITLLYRGDAYYSGLLLDTPEAGLLDLMDMDKDAVGDWVEGFRTLFAGVDGFKIPVLYDHEQPAKWIPFGRSPHEMLYDNAYMKYGQIVGGGYGLRLSDIGMDGTSNSTGEGGGGLANTIRGERQSKRNGRAAFNTLLSNYFNRLLKGTGLKFIWIDQDQEDTIVRGRAMLASVTALKTATEGEQPLITAEEARMQLAEDGVFTIDLDPNEVPEPKPPQLPMGAGGAGNAMEKEKPSPSGANEKKPPSQGGRGEDQNFLQRFFNRNRPDEGPDFSQATIVMRTRLEGQPPLPIAETKSAMQDEIRPLLSTIVNRATDIRFRRLIKASSKALFPEIQRSYESLSNVQVADYWHPEQVAIVYGLDSAIDKHNALIARTVNQEMRDIIEQNLRDDPWWQIESDEIKQNIALVLQAAFERGVFEEALMMIQALYEEGLVSSSDLEGIDFNLTNPRTLNELVESAAELVKRIDEGTRYYIKNAVIAGTREGLASPRIADLIRSGVGLEEILKDEGFMDEAIEVARSTLEGISDNRANSIVNTEINRAENEGNLEQMKRSGLKLKQWKHLGKRGITPKGNPHPCKVCTANEEKGVVPIDFEYETVFKGETIQTPPGHPQVCHCKIFFEEGELFDLVGSDGFTPWTGE